MAAKCLDRLKDGYRLDGNYIKVAWATNKGINKDRRIKQYWNVDVGCTYIPFTELDTIRVNTNDFVKWAEGGLVDEDSIPEKYLDLYKKQVLQNSANTVDSNSSKSQEGACGVEKQSEQTSKDHDMDLDTDDDHDKATTASKPAGLEPAQQQQQPFQPSFMPQNAAIFKIPIQLQSAPPGLMQNNFNSQLQFAQAIAQAKNPYLSTINPFGQFFNANQVLSGPPPPPPPASSPSAQQKANAQFQQFHFSDAQLNETENKPATDDPGVANGISSTTMANGAANNNNNNGFGMKTLLPIYNFAQPGAQGGQQLMQPLQLQQTHLVDLFKHQQGLENSLAGVRQFGMPNQHLIPHFQLIQRPILMAKPGGKPGLQPPPPNALNPGLLRHIGLMQTAGVGNPGAIHFQTIPLQSQAQAMSEDEFKQAIGGQQQQTTSPPTANATNILQNQAQFGDLAQLNNSKS